MTTYDLLASNKRSTAMLLLLIYLTSYIIQPR